MSRAKSRLFFVESSSAYASAAVKLLEQGSSEPLVEITKLGTLSFKKHLGALFPNTSVEESQKTWQSSGRENAEHQNWEAAVRCFRRAGDKTSEAIAGAKMEQDYANLAKAGNDRPSAATHVSNAALLWLQAERKTEAIQAWLDVPRILNFSEKVKLPKPMLILAEEAIAHAMTHLKELAKHDEVATVMLELNLHDRLLNYAPGDLIMLSSEVKLAIGARCKSLLEEKSLPSRKRELALGLLATDAEREQVMMELVLEHDLRKFYLRQSCHEDLYAFYMKHCFLKEALSLALDGPAPWLHSLVSDGSLVKILDYLYAGHFFTANGSSTPQMLNARLRQDDLVLLKYRLRD